MDLATIEQRIVSAARRHPNRRTIVLAGSGETLSVQLAIFHTVSTRISGGQAIIAPSVTNYLLLKRYCTRRPSIGDSITDGSDVWTIRDVSNVYGGLGYQCSVDLQQ